MIALVGAPQFSSSVVGPWFVVRPFVRPSVRQSARPSVRPSVHPSVRPSIKPYVKPRTSYQNDRPLNLFHRYTSNRPSIRTSVRPSVRTHTNQPSATVQPFLTPALPLRPSKTVYVHPTARQSVQTIEPSDRPSVQIRRSISHTSAARRQLAKTDA